MWTSYSTYNVSFRDIGLFWKLVIVIENFSYHNYHKQSCRGNNVDVIGIRLLPKEIIKSLLFTTITTSYYMWNGYFYDVQMGLKSVFRAFNAFRKWILNCKWYENDTLIRQLGHFRERSFVIRNCAPSQQAELLAPWAIYSKCHIWYFVNRTESKLYFYLARSFL
jgi:hypothetical protein